MAKDAINIAVRVALEKDGWEITNDPFTLETGDILIDMDLAAEKFLLAEKGYEKIIVEIKSFGRRSLVYDFHGAIGQYIDYRGALKDEGIVRRLFLAISEETFENFSKARFFARRIEENNIHLLVVNIVSETVVKWVK